MVVLLALVYVIKRHSYANLRTLTLFLVLRTELRGTTGKENEMGAILAGFGK